MVYTCTFVSFIIVKPGQPSPLQKAGAFPKHSSEYANNRSVTTAGQRKLISIFQLKNTIFKILRDLYHIYTIDLKNKHYID